MTSGSVFNFLLFSKSTNVEYITFIVAESMGNSYLWTNSLIFEFLFYIFSIATASTLQISYCISHAMWFRTKIGNTQLMDRC